MFLSFFNSLKCSHFSFIHAFGNFFKMFLFLTISFPYIFALSIFLSHNFYTLFSFFCLLYPIIYLIKKRLFSLLSNIECAAVFEKPPAESVHCVHLTAIRPMGGPFHNHKFHHRNVNRNTRIWDTVYI